MMPRAGRLSLLMVVLGALGASQAAAQGELTLSERVERLERQAGSEGGGATADLLIRLRQLEDEVRELRGLVEQQQHEIESFKARQRDQYLDLDRRLQSLSNGRDDRRGGGNDGNAGPDGNLEERRSETREPAGDPPVGPNAVPEQAAAESRQPVADAGARQDMYDAAFSKLRDSEYAAAAEAFQAFLDEYPDGPLADNAQYWLGESYYVTGNYDIALNAFQAVLNQFPQSRKAPDAMLKLGFCYYELEQWDEARETLEQVRERYPDSSVARLAQNRLRMMRIDDR